jgi:TRAP-type C4-dicarboxylate transport system permease large subunit
VEPVIFLVMVGVFAVAAFAAKFPISLSMLLGAVGGLLVSGMKFELRHLVEGTFGYVDTILVIATAMIFMVTVKESGALDSLNIVIIRRFHQRPVLLLPLLMFVAMFPGLITGSSSAAVLTAGAVVAPVLMILGMPRPVAGAFIAIAGILGMIAPPVNIPAMIIGGGIDMPFVGFEIPLLLLTVPLAIVFAWWIGLRSVHKTDWEELKGELDIQTFERYGVRLFIPVILVVVLMVLGKVYPQVFGLGLPLIFVIGTAASTVVGKRFSILSAAKKAVDDALPVLGILAGVGMFIQVMTLTGVRGFVVVGALSVSPALLYLAIAVTMPLFGAVSSFGSASVLGVPFLLAFLGKDQIVTASALSLMASLGDFMPPTALSAIFAAQVVGEEGYGRVLRVLILPSVVIAGWALLFILFAQEIGSLY